jgi:uncharacterized membrane protein YfcA
VHWVAIIVIGALVGYLGGLFGKGGSAIATPLLAAAGVPPIVAVASPLPATVPGTLVAYRRYQQLGLSDPSVIRTSLAVGIPATLVGACASHWIAGGTLLVVTDVLVALIGLRILLRGRPSDVGVDNDPEHRGLRLVAVAGAVGLLAGLLANAGGFLLVPLYLAALKLPVKTALACSLAVASVLALPGTIVHAALGQIDWRVALVFGAASIPLSGLGAATAIRISSARLERIYGAGLLVLGATFLLIR